MPQQMQRVRFFDYAPPPAGPGRRSTQVRDVERGQPPNLSGHTPPEYDEQLTGGGTKPGSQVGPQLVMELDGAATSYAILALGNGKCGLFRVGSASNVLDPGVVNKGSGMSTDRLTRLTRAIDGVEKKLTKVEHYLNAPKRIAARDAAWSQNRLRQINEANRKFYGGNDGRT